MPDTRVILQNLLAFLLHNTFKIAKHMRSNTTAEGIVFSTHKLTSVPSWLFGF